MSLRPEFDTDVLCVFSWLYVRTVLKVPSDLYCSATTFNEVFSGGRFSLNQFRTDALRPIWHTGLVGEQIPALWLAGEHPQHALVQRRRRHGEPVPQRPVPPAGNVSGTKWDEARGRREIPLRADFVTLLPQAFSDYQIQQMTANFVDQFGFNDEEFSEHDENIKLVETKPKKRVRSGRPSSTVWDFQLSQDFAKCLFYRQQKVAELRKITESFGKVMKSDRIPYERAECLFWMFVFFDS